MIDITRINSLQLANPKLCYMIQIILSLIILVLKELIDLNSMSIHIGLFYA